MTNEWAIDVKDLTKKFHQKVAVDNISLQVKRGTIFGFLGPNGSGKTTTLRMICGLLTPTAGQGMCLGYDIRTQHEEIKRHIGYMPQQFSFYVNLTVYQNLQFISDIYQMDKAADTIESILQALQLEQYRHTLAANLSGGWKQRLALACCLVHKPQLLFLDEPTAGVDPKARKEFWDYLHQISVEDNTTILVTTHYMDEAEKCNDLAYIYLGKLLYAGSTKDLIPESQVKTYIFEGKTSDQSAIIQRIQKQFPSLLASIVNNSLRISGRDKTKLERFIESYPQGSFRDVVPSFEEVFIGLMQNEA
ncbi:MAG: ABC transporter ATP-binding protein [Legionella sp.]|nr:ABC transporter ATP-binding protein [Legionella sp.]